MTVHRAASGPAPLAPAYRAAPRAEQMRAAKTDWTIEWAAAGFLLLAVIATFTLSAGMLTNFNIH